MRLRLSWTAACAATVLTGAAFADVTVSQSNDPSDLFEGEFASVFGAEHMAVSALPTPKLKALATGPQAAVAPVSQAAEKPAADAAEKPAAGKAAADPAAKPAAQPVVAVKTAAAAPSARAESAADPATGPAAPQSAEVTPDTAVTKTKRRSSPFAFLRRDDDDAPQPTLIRYDMGWLNEQPAPQGDAQWQCLRSAIYFESRGETLKGQFAVAEVILNRVDSPRYPKTICGVVQQSCQFSYTCDGVSDRMTDPEAAGVAGRIARVMMDGAPRALTMGATHFHTRSVRPGWANRFPQTAAIGAHLFYRQP